MKRSIASKIKMLGIFTWEKGSFSSITKGAMPLADEFLIFSNKFKIIQNIHLHCNTAWHHRAVIFGMVVSVFKFLDFRFSVTAFLIYTHSTRKLSASLKGMRKTKSSMAMRFWNCSSLFFIYLIFIFPHFPSFPSQKNKEQKWESHACREKD